MDKRLIIIAMLLLLVPCAHGALQVDVQTHENRIFQDEEANFTIKVKNPEDYRQSVEFFYPSGTSWSIIADPMISKRELGPHETINTEVKIKAVDNRLIPKKYELPFTISSKTDDIKVKKEFEIYLRDPSAYRNYVPIVNVDIDATEELKPTEKARLSLILKNLNNLNITDFTFKVETSVNPSNDKTIKLHLPPNGKAKEEVLLEYSPDLRPTTDVVTITPSIPSHNKTFEKITKRINIEGYTKIESTKTTKEGFLKRTEIFNFTNLGNIEAKKTKSVSSTVFKKLFTSSSREYEEVNKNGLKHLVWDLEILPGQTEQISYTINYRPLFVIIILIIIAGLVYYFGRSPVTIKKEAKKIPGFEGETSRLKVLLHVKNRTTKPLENLNVIDRIPKIAQLGKKKSIGTMHPSKVVNNEKKGTMVKWNIPVLEAYEERIISYQIYSKLEIIGPMTLSKAVLKYKNKRGKNSRIFSNPVQST
ncbi:MAG: hypothetical protein ACQESF_04225 [Nanobdellota archaeon]